MITDLNHRYFRFRIGDRWITLPQLGTSSKLWFYILKYKPHDVYFSETRFLNPQNIDKQKCPVILGSDFIIDCDRTTEDNVINIINKMWQLYKKKQIYIINTSKDSWQINFGKLDVELPQDYKLRGDAIKKRKKKIFDSLDGCEFDHLTDWKRIYRLPESPRYKDSKWGIVSYPSSGKLVSVMNGGVSIDEGTEQNGNLNSLPRQITSRKTECSVRSYARYTTNKKGNEYFPILKYVGRDYYKYKRELKKNKKKSKIEEQVFSKGGEVQGTFFSEKGIVKKIFNYFSSKREKSSGANVQS